MRAITTTLCILLLCGCFPSDRSAADGEASGRRLDFPDIIDHHGVPAAAEDWSLVPFTDQGAWFGFALPPEDRKEQGGGISGPFLMGSGRWLAAEFFRLDLDGMETIRSTGYPGFFVLESRAGDLLVDQRLWFDSDRIALVRTRIHNGGAESRTIELAWSGGVFADMAVLEPDENGVLARTNDGSIIRVIADRKTHPPLVTENRFRLPLGEAFVIAPGDSITLGLAIALTHDGDPDPDRIAALSAMKSSYVQNAARWGGYLDGVFAGVHPGEAVEVITVKSIQTLVNNWRGPTGRMRHGGLFPSSNVWYFNGFWAWDSWKHAVGLARFDLEIAKGQLRLMFDHQDDSGMIADVVYLDPTEDNWRDTKPPLAGWALEAVFQESRDLDLVKELYPKLVDYHQFWYTHRDHDGDGLCEYGSADGTLQAARWESGMDNAVRFDETRMLQNGPGAWSMNQESVDLNSYLYRDKMSLHTLAAALGRANEAAKWAADADSLRDIIRNTMFNDATGWYHDIDIDTGEFISAQGPEGWIPLWAGVATQEQAARLHTTMLDPTKFLTHAPFPTVARDNPEFSEGYWRGLVWIDQVYFAIEGLRRYGFGDDADVLTHQVFMNLEGAARPGVPLRENYHPLTGKGHNVKHFSWTAAHLLLLARALD